ncbi:type VII secretion target [Lentzea nigeriaca]|uniref:type VII secretion target n=1 Tax=Lentzea nigeriaca TaxID=1128665 RepID=UPI00195A5EC6|nr:type VII secretion target [Lentzea nigeriaca]MBM7860462.1 uncharacterized protein YukE [Lentzea nigeriaca]
MSEELQTSGKVGALSGGSWSGIFGGGLGAIVSAAKAVSVAVETQQLSVDPHLVDAMIKKLNEMKETLSTITARSKDLSMDPQLGDGYAQQVSQANMKFGRDAAQQITEIGKAIDSLKAQIEKSRASYHNVDQAGADSMKKLNGKS